MKVTVCELPDQEAALELSWTALHEHLLNQHSDLVLLPEMPFCKWVASTPAVDKALQQSSVAKHDAWMSKLEALPSRYVIYSRPVLSGSKYYNTAFVYEKGIGHRPLHTKYYFPEEPHFWEATWYDRAAADFQAVELDGFKIGVLLCTEMWFTDLARAYGKQDVDLLLCPRATGKGSVPQWQRLGQTLSVISGAFCLSSNKSGLGDEGFKWGGTGWITKPGSGNILGDTSTEPFVTVEIDLKSARKAKQNYPLYVKG